MAAITQRATSVIHLAEFQRDTCVIHLVKFHLGGQGSGAGFAVRGLVDIGGGASSWGDINIIPYRHYI